MSVKVITDSVADLPRHIVEELGIVVVPLLLRFGEAEYRDGVDLSVAEFYTLLDSSPHFPATAFPPAARFAEAYDQLACEGSDVVVITLSEKLSGTYNAAVTAKTMAKGGNRVEVVDSTCAAMIEGFVAMKAAQAASQGASIEETVEVAKEASRRAHLLATFRTLEYLYRGGRIGKARAFLGSALKVHPFIGLKDGAVRPVGAATNRAKAVDKLVSFAGGFSHIEELGVEHTQSPDEAELMIDRLSQFHPRERIHVSTMTPVIGSHTGPGLLVVCVLGDK
ncbi:MAG: DegV family protein [Spirochaetales bacterium]|nr:DegV family protein [Spirochaetales bacterium]